MILLGKQEAVKIDEYIFNRIGIPRSVLVERAGLAVARRCISILDDGLWNGMTADVFAGKGMNGADAMVCARELHSAGITVHLWEVFPENGRNDDLSWIRNVCVQLDIQISPAKLYRSETRSLIIDGIFGTSFDRSRVPDEDTMNVFHEIAKAKKLGSIVVSIDIPSGVDCDTAEVSDFAIDADETITFISCKTGIAGFPGRKHAGRITIDRLGMPSELEDMSGACASSHKVITMEDAAALLPAREADGHKGTFGRVGILGGSKGMAGAVCLCAISCMRTGAGLVYLIVPDDIAGMCLVKVPEALVFSAYDQLPAKPDVFIAGPGGSKNKVAEEGIYRAISAERLLVLDAQALNIIAMDPSRAKKAFESRQNNGLPFPVLTPHPGEMDRLMPESAHLPRTEKALAAAKTYRCVAVLKGAGTVVALPDGGVWINTSGNSSMAKGGSGDILAGMIGAMLAQGLTPAEAAVFGVYFHGLCGDLACGQWDVHSAIPSDIIEEIPAAFKIIKEKIAGQTGRRGSVPENLECCGSAVEPDTEKTDE
ncbi:MAG: NAD(P)H-hydrate dehydratase [Saccharofermentanales bacterium]